MTQFQEATQFTQQAPQRGGEIVFQPWNPLGASQATVVSPLERSLMELQEKERALNERQAALTAKEAELQKSIQESAEQAVLIKSAIDALENAKKGFWAENGQEVVAFTFALAETILLKKLDEDPAVYTRQIKAVVEEMKISESIDVQMAAPDLQILQKSQDKDVKALLADERIRWHGNPQLPKGGIYVDTSQYRLDASIMTALKNLREDSKAKD